MNTIVFDSGIILVEINHPKLRGALLEPEAGAQNGVLSTGSVMANEGKHPTNESPSTVIGVEG